MGGVSDFRDDLDTSGPQARAGTQIRPRRLFEVFKRVCLQRDEDEALRAIALMEQGTVVDLDRATALEAARLSVQHRLAMADSE